jgi:hypothetical protein
VRVPKALFAAAVAELRARPVLMCRGCTGWLVRWRGSGRRRPADHMKS